MKRLEQQLRSLLSSSRGGGGGAPAAAAGAAEGEAAASEPTTSTTTTLRGENFAAPSARPLAATRNASAAPTEGTAFDNASSSGDKNSDDGEGSASRGGATGGTTAAAATRKPAAEAKAATETKATTATTAAATEPSPSSSSQLLPIPRAPASFYCPISMELMADPVVVATGHTYDRRCIERWLGAGHGTCPATGARLRHLELTPNFALRDAVAEWALREGVPVPQPEDGAGRTAAALLYKGGGGGGGGGEEGGGGSARGGEGSSSSSSRRRAAAAAAAAVSRSAEEAAAPATTTEAEEGEQAPRRATEAAAAAAAAAAPGAAAAQNNDAADAGAEASPPSSLHQQQQPPPTILRGHDEIVWAVEASPRDGRLFSASADRSVRVWDVASRRCEAVLEDHARPVLCLALAPAADEVEDGGDAAAPSGGENAENEFSGDDLLFSGSYDFTIKVWSLRTLSRVRTLTGHGDAVRSLLYVPPKKGDGGKTRSSGGVGGGNLPLGRRGRLFSASYDGTVRVWDVATLEPVATLPGHSGPVRTLASVDGLVFSGSYDKTIRAWHADSLNPAACLTGHTAAVRALVAVDRSKIPVVGGSDGSPATPLGPLLFSGSDDGTVRAWCPRTLTCVATLRGHEDNVRVLAATTTTTTAAGGGAGGESSPNTPALLFSGSWDRTVRAWCLRSLRCVRVLRGHGEAVLALAVGRRCVASGSYDASVRLWDLAGIVAEGGEGGGEAAGTTAAAGGAGAVDDEGEEAEQDQEGSSAASRLPPPASRACAGHEDAVRVLTADGQGHVFSGSYDGSVGIWSEEGF